jgi:pimeloyl-ACP methyl ester carboxylesterase
VKNFLQKIRYGARVLLSRGAGHEDTVSLPGRDIILRHGGEGPPLVYLHSALAEGALWLPYMQNWTKHFHVYVPLHPGFGTSGGFDRIDTIDDMAFHYAELFDALGLEEFILVGHSLGGWIATEYAIRWPERVKKLILSGAPGLYVEGHPLPDLFRLTQQRDALRRLLFHDPTGPMASLVIQEKPDEKAMLLAYQAMTVLARLVWRRPYDPKLADRLYRVTCPTLLVWGASDRLVPPAYGEAYHRAIAQSQYVTIPNCGHLPMFECESEYMNHVVQFAQS